VGLSRRFWVRALLFLSVLGAVALVGALREPILQGAGRVLVAEDAIAPADAIVVASDGSGPGALEAADLVRLGVATRVAVFAYLEDPVVEREFARRGIPLEDAAARSVRQLMALGVENAEIIPTRIAGSEDQGRVLPPWCARNGFRSIVVVAEADHSRRLRRILRRAFRGQGAAAHVRVSRYSTFDPDRWWKSRTGVRAGVVELQKLLLDLLRHPLPEAADGPRTSDGRP
jgi:uncharacterized SAM-binding protein YcdF (DUF218 family)